VCGSWCGFCVGSPLVFLTILLSLSPTFLSQRNLSLSHCDVHSLDIFLQLDWFRVVQPASIMVELAYNN
jgi:hypothetical protein